MLHEFNVFTWTTTSNLREVFLYNGERVKPEAESHIDCKGLGGRFPKRQLVVLCCPLGSSPKNREKLLLPCFFFLGFVLFDMKSDVI